VNGAVPVGTHRTAASPTDAAAARAVAAEVRDPEIPVLTLEDLGILREVEVVDGRIHVVLTPTYTGCPATVAIAGEVRSALAGAGWPDAIVETRLAPPWSTDWISARGRERLRAYGIAPPGPAGAASTCAAGGATPRPLLRRIDTRVGDEPACPNCSSPRVERIAEHGSTPCKALYRCLTCAEPFDYFKPY
jgi:ring-1,2-phenylacetyl-CoA epoxidase subunit PaaD